ncbi:adenine phosphoribosyltransferase [Nakamurella sp. GG22]
MPDAAAEINRLVRIQQDFPQPGVLFRDLTPVLADPTALDAVARALAAAAPDATLIAGLESRGFLLGAAAAMVAGTGVLAIRKPGKLPGSVLSESYQLEYGSARLELHPDDVPPGARVLVIDDVLATGGTAAAACRLLRRAGADIAGVAVAVELTDLGGRAALPGLTVTALTSW